MTTFEEYMLQHGMNDPSRLPPEDLARWKAKYALGFPPEPPGEVKPADPSPADPEHAKP